jgi:hypothetical protein
MRAPPVEARNEWHGVSVVRAEILMIHVVGLFPHIHGQRLLSGVAG